MGEHQAAYVGAAIHRHRSAAGLTQQELARRAGLSVRAVRDIEQGRIGRPRSRSVRGLLDALALSVQEHEALLSVLTAAGGSGGQLRIGVLGPLDVVVNGSPLDIRSERQRTVVALLALQHGRTVPVDDFVDALWGDRPPRTARNLVQLYVGEVRALLGPAGHTVRFAGLGYAAELSFQEVDLARFEDLETRAQAAWTDGHPAQAAELYADALRCWRGPALVDAGDRLRQHPAAIAAGQRRIAATVAYADAAIALGAGERAIPALRALCREEPLQEAVHGRLMLALAAADERAAALRVFADLRAVLADELGVEPGAALADIHLRILRGARPATGAAPADRPARRIPAQLPAATSPFVGRTPQLAALDQLLTTDSVAVVAGTAGAGKTALAVHWAHLVAEKFPDGQLYLNLRGYDPDTPLDPADALARLLTGLGVPGADLALTVDERAAQLRTELAGRRVLMLLDNAGTAEQVRPLLPGTAGCAVVVTSRDDLAGLVATQGARRVDLDLLREDESVVLLRRLLGTRAQASLDAVVALARQCAHLPLALRVAAELAAARSQTPLADLVAELADHHQRLRSLDAGGDPRAAVATVFSWSMRNLSADDARTFRLLGLHPGADLDPYAAAALADTTPRQAGRTLAALGRAHLTQANDAGRHGMHDLLRAYAIQLCGERERASAYGRLLDFYLATAAAAMDVLHPAEAHRRPRVPESPTPMPDLSAAASALAWLDAERPTLVAVVAYAAAHGRGSHAIRLATVLFRYLEASHYTDALIIYRHALAAARLDGDRAAQAHALHGLGCFHFKCGQFDLAADYLRTARRHFRHVGDRGGEARALNNLGSVEQRRGRYGPAADLHRRALNRYLDVGDQLGQVRALINLGRDEYQLGRLDASAGHVQRALTLCRTIGDAPGDGDALERLGRVEHRRGHHSRAAELYLRSLRQYQRNGDRSGEASAMASLGVVYPELGRHTEAADLLRQAETMFRELGDQNGEGNARNGLGEAARATGQHAEALDHHTAALTLTTISGARDEQARAHAGLGHAHDALGSPTDAGLHFGRAVALYANLRMPEAETLRAHVAERRRRATPPPGR
ncbi:BTAD domain-containing putative transcriptional regulator [Asanoa ishikariensis]|uniref:BTAD domain-containing putative transcriptional regulator n=1 Tax=Asanoa ishikariensis TaxID=137265 RepID=UPI0015A36BFE|nr:BTAD domain-containing putative transcriptional regulator [Asanoa ishikariensis]